MLEYYKFPIATVDTASNKKITTVLTAGTLTLMCTLIFDDDSISDTFNHWICCLDVVSDELDIPERSFVIYPNTLLFDGDETYVVAITSELTDIGLNDLGQAFITVGVVVNE